MSAPIWGLEEVIAAACGPVVKIWDPSAPQRAVKINEGTSVCSVAFSRNNKVLAVAGDKGQAALYSGKGASPEVPAQVAGQVPPVPAESAITCTTFMPNDKGLVGGCEDGVVRLWELAGQEDTTALEPMTGSVTSVAVVKHMDAMDVVAASSTSGQVVLHGIRDSISSAKKLKTLLHKGTRVNCLSFAPHQQHPLLCCAMASGQLLVWDIGHAGQGPTEMAVHRAAVTGCQFAPDDCNLLLSCGQDGLLVATDRRSREAAWSANLKQPLSSLSMRWDGSMVAVGTSSGSVLLHDTRNVSSQPPMQQFSAEQPVTALCWQHMPSARSSRGRHSMGTAQTASTYSSLAPASHEGPGNSSSSTAEASSKRVAAAAATAAAPKPSQPVGVGGAAPVVSQLVVPAYKAPPVVPHYDGITPQSHGNKSAASSSSDAGDYGLQVVSPMRLYASPLDSSLGDAGSHSTGTAGELGAAAGARAAAGALHTPEQAMLNTPADSFASGAGFRGPVMFTPMMGYAGNAGSTPLGDADATPVSRLTGVGVDAAADNAVLGRTAALAPSAAATGAAVGRAPAGSRAADSSMLKGAADTAGTRSAAITRVAAADATGPGSRPSNAAAVVNSHRRKASDPAVSAAASAQPAAAASRGRPGTASTSDPADGTVVVSAGAGGTTHSNKGYAGDAATVAAAARSPAKPPAADPSNSAASRPSSSSAPVVTGVTVAALREDVFKACIDELRAEQDEKFAQLFQNQGEIVAAMNSLAARQEQLVDAMTQLSSQLSSLSSNQQQQQQQYQQYQQYKYLPQPGVSAIPWI